MTDEEIMRLFVKNEQQIIELKDEIHRLQTEIDWLKRQIEIKKG